MTAHEEWIGATSKNGEKVSSSVRVWDTQNNLEVSVSPLTYVVQVATVAGESEVTACDKVRSHYEKKEEFKDWKRQRLKHIERRMKASTTKEK